MGQEVLVGGERRRRWSDAQKLAIIGEVGVDGLTVSDVARRHEISRQHIYQWRAELRRKALGSEDGDEPPRVCRRLQLLSRMERHEQNNEQILT